MPPLPEYKPAILIVEGDPITYDPRKWLLDKGRIMSIRLQDPDDLLSHFRGKKRHRFFEQDKTYNRIKPPPPPHLSTIETPQPAGCPPSPETAEQTTTETSTSNVRHRATSMTQAMGLAEASAIQDPETSPSLSITPTITVTPTVLEHTTLAPATSSVERPVDITEHCATTAFTGPSTPPAITSDRHDVVFVLEEMIAKGRIWDVYLAVAVLDDLPLDSPAIEVVIKVCASFNWCESPAIHENYMYQTSLEPLQGIVVPVYGGLFRDGLRGPFIQVMEFAGDILVKGTRLQVVYPDPQHWPYIIQQYKSLHASGIVHRNIEDVHILYSMASNNNAIRLIGWERGRDFSPQAIILTDSEDDGEDNDTELVIQSRNSRRFREEMMNLYFHLGTWDSDGVNG